MSSLLVAAIIQKVKENLFAVVMLFYMLKITEVKVEYFSKEYQCTSFCSSKLGGTAVGLTSQVRTINLVVVGYENIYVRR